MLNNQSTRYIETREDRDKLMSSVGRFDKILNAVSSFWEGKELSEYLNSGGSFEPAYGAMNAPFVYPRDDKVGYLDKSRCEAPPLQNRVEYFPPASSSSVTQSVPDPAKQRTSPFSHVKLPPEVRMITYSDEIPKPDLPPPPGPMLPDISSDSPLTLLAAGDGGDMLENLDNAVLENIVPRDPTTGRPLTIGSIEHPDGTCRPCIFFLRAKCFKGLRCTFCHFNHTALRKQILVPPPPTNLCPQTGGSNCEASEPTGAKPVTKTKRLRPSKRTRELIKQINAQSSLHSDPNIAAECGDPNGPPLSVLETTAPSNIQVIPQHR